MFIWIFIKKAFTFIAKYFYFNSIQIGAFDPEKGEDSKKQRDKERKNQRVQKYTTTEDWNDVE